VQTHRRHLSELAASQADNHSVLCEARPHSVDEAGASHHQLLPCRVQDEYRLLPRFLLERTVWMFGPDHDLTDSGGIGRVILLAALDER
jgi:hypothetical protein